MAKLSSSHKRREGYWQYYERARKEWEDFSEETMLWLLEKYPHPARKVSSRGREPTHSKEKLDFACLDMTRDNDTYRAARDGLKRMRHVWDEPLPSHKEIVTHMQGVDLGWLDSLVAITAFLCLGELSKCNATAPLGADSSGVETSRYVYTETPGMTLDDFADMGQEPPRRKEYLKYHITAVLGHQIILTAITTQGNVHDSIVLPQMLENVIKFGFDVVGRGFMADRGYDVGKIRLMLIAMGMISNIKHREYSSRRGKSSTDEKTFRELTAEMFNPSAYKQRSMIEGIFGAEETKRHQLHCRFVRDDNRNRFSKFRAIAWNIGVLGRFRCANKLGIPIPSYKDLPYSAPADVSELQQVLA